MITYRKGDLFASGLPALAHGCNCKGVMGAGIAAQFRRRWPRMYEMYWEQCARGGFLPGDALPWKAPGGPVIFSLATQPGPGANARTWMISAAAGRMIAGAIYGYGITEIGLPMIGCGIGGLRAGDLREALEPYADAPVNLTVFEYAP